MIVNEIERSYIHETINSHIQGSILLGIVTIPRIWFTNSSIYIPFNIINKRQDLSYSRPRCCLHLLVQIQESSSESQQRQTIGAFLKRVLESVFCRFEITVLIRSDRSDSGIRSILFKAKIALLVVISPMTIHSAVWAWIPFKQSITMMSMSMICAPPRIVRIRLAWPGQSTRVYWMYLYLSPTQITQLKAN